MKEVFKPVALTFFLMCSASMAVSQSEPTYEELPNFHQVNTQLYRGGQPKVGGVQRLAQMGVKAIINLRADDEHSRLEEQEARAVGLKYFNVPFHRLARPTEEQISLVLSLIDAAENQPVFVHCKHGADRTGVVIAIYRIDHDGWSSERAKAEADRYGLKPWQLGMKDFIGDYYRRRSLRVSRAPYLASSH